MTRKPPRPTRRRGAQNFELRARIGGKIKVKTLGTADASEAALRVSTVWAEMLRDAEGTRPATAELFERYRAHLIERLASRDAADTRALVTAVRGKKGLPDFAPVGLPSYLGIERQAQLDAELNRSRHSAFAGDFTEQKEWLAAQGVYDASTTTLTALAATRDEVLRNAATTTALHNISSSTPTTATTATPPTTPTMTATTWEAIIANWEEQHRRNGGAASTRPQWRALVMRFAANSGITNPGAVTSQDIRRWRDRLLDEGLSGKTVRASCIGALSAVYAAACEEEIMTSNPAAGIKVKNAKSRKMRDFTDEQASAILHAAKKATDPACRWVPWLCAFTGSRVSTMVNLRACDVKEIAEKQARNWCVEITREAGPVKTDDSERIVPLHPVITSDGFLAFVEKRRKAHGDKARLFYGTVAETRDKDSKHNPGKSKLNDLRDWVHDQGIEGVGRKHSTDPFHAWRHWCKTRLARHGTDDRVSDAITGHAVGAVKDGYKHPKITEMAAAIARVPVP